MHRPELYGHTHKAHHGAILPNVWHTYVSTRAEDTLFALGLILPCLYFVYTSSVLETYLALLAAGFIINLRGILRHDYRFRAITGTHHLVHHMFPNRNYSVYWIDWLFGTLATNDQVSMCRSRHAALYLP